MVHVSQKPECSSWEQKCQGSQKERESTLKREWRSTFFPTLSLSPSPVLFLPLFLLSSPSRPLSHSAPWLMHFYDLAVALEQAGWLSALKFTLPSPSSPTEDLKV